MSTSSAAIHAWPSSAMVNQGLRQLIRPGQPVLVDGAAIPAYYLSGTTRYSQWVDTTAPRFAGPGGQARMTADLANGDFKYVLYNSYGATPGVDRSLLATLRNRYTLIAEVPVSAGDPHAHWFLWLSELPR
jgi:hypothetical protein